MRFFAAQYQRQVIKQTFPLVFLMFIVTILYLNVYIIQLTIGQRQTIKIVGKIVIPFLIVVQSLKS